MSARLAGRAKGRFHLGQNSDINVTPFVDVMLVLLIIFMVAAPLATVSIRVDQPLSEPQDPSGKPPTLVSITDDGRLFVTFGAGAARESSLASLGSDVAASLAVARPTAERVVVRAERHVRYGQFMRVLNTLKAGGYNRIALINENLAAS